MVDRFREMLKANKTYQAAALTLGALAFLLSTAVLFNPTKAQESCSFDSNRVSVVIGFPAGSSDDLAVRQVRPFLQKHLPGNPTVFIENNPGAGGILAVNRFYQAAPTDGTAAGMFTGFPLRYALDDEAILFDIDEMQLLGVQPTNQVTLIAESVGINEPRDLLEVKEPLLVGTSSRRAAPFVANVTFFDLLGVPHKDLTGYRGQGEILHAIRTQELNVAPFAWTRYMATRMSLEDEGLMKAVWQRGYLQTDGSVKPEPALEVPTQAEIVAELRPDVVGTPTYNAMNTVVGLFGVARSYWLPPGTSDCLAGLWQDALAAVYSDPEYVAMIKEQTKMDSVFYGPEDGRTLFKSVFDNFTDSEIRSIVLSIIDG